MAGASGFIALSYEILWYRLYSFVSWGAPRTFGLLLAAYLYGIAYGSYRAGLYCEKRSEEGARTPPLVVLGRFLLLASVLAYLVAPVLAYTVTVAHFLFSLAAVILATTVLGAVLPLVSHMAIAPDDRAGSRLSYLYLANIVGSASGSLLTGFVAMDFMSTRALALALGLAAVALAALVLFTSGLRPRQLATSGVEIAAVAVAMVLGSHPLFDQLYERLHYKTDFQPDLHFAEMVENRSGVISVTTDGRVWGGGAYDGAINTSIVSDENWIVRAYMVSVMHPNPRQMLMIGLASGSWAEVLANAPGLEKLTIVEINPGYLGIIAKHPEVSSILKNPKVDIVIDDGRRWLLGHPDSRFDAIVMNTSWHWRAHASDLLSKEFLELGRAHLNDGGLIFYNTTGSHDVYKTALAVFPYALRVVNFVAVSDSPFSVDKDAWRDLLQSYRLEGEKILDLSKSEDRTAFDKLLDLADSLHRAPEGYALESRESLLTRTADGKVITDDNMACEWEVFFPQEL